MMTTGTALPTLPRTVVTLGLPPRMLPVPPRSAVLTRPVLHSTRAPQQLCLDLQPRLR